MGRQPHHPQQRACRLRDRRGAAGSCRRRRRRVDLTALAANWDALAKRSGTAECGAVVKADAYGCGIDPVAATLAKAGCKTFFVSNLAEARRVRATVPKSAIYVLNGLYTGSAEAFADIDVRPVITSLTEMSEWDVFTAASGWSGGCALNVDTGGSRLAISMDEAAALAPRAHSPTRGFALLMSRLEYADRPDHPLNDRQIAAFRELRRLYSGIPASLANSAGIFRCGGPLRPGAARRGPLRHQSDP